MFANKIVRVEPVPKQELLVTLPERTTREIDVLARQRHHDVKYRMFLAILCRESLDFWRHPFPAASA